ncbi:EBSC protein [Solibacillus sp. R5-41]|uniref:YbaK/EbsC family protein n=1 Tax=Solibacillus sp. R5-41 TaxID=2048654 RepID=UPI000C128B20|nr:YbaK/EbsC family protein [Solibacillus sp. R5-41]ATP39727.1 EBSC protein [Solibacillus sp. R5-41]
MALLEVKAFFKQHGKEQSVLEFNSSSATVQEAALVLNVIPARIAKTLSFYGQENMAILIVAAGDTKIDNAKFKQQFGMKAKMLDPESVVNQTGHRIGGVCPFALANELPIYLDHSLKRFATVFPACGSANSAIELTCDELQQYSNANGWVDVCKDWQ